MSNLVYLTTEETADRLRLKTTTLERWRVDGNGPVFLKLGRRVVYPLAQLDEWVAAKIRHSTSDRGGATAGAAPQR